MSNVDESWFFCNSWECKYRKNEKLKNKMLCDMAFDGCPYDDEFYEELRNRKEVNKDD